MTVEDAVEFLDQHTHKGLFKQTYPDQWALGFVHNVAAYTRKGAALSTEQARIVLSLISRVRSYLINHNVCLSVVDTLIRYPTYRQAPYTSTVVPREVRHLGDNLLGFRFKRNDAVLADLKWACGGLEPFGMQALWFDRTYKVWVAPVTRRTINPLMEVIGKHRFNFDDALADYLATATNVGGLPTAVITDRDQGLIAAQVYDDEVSAFFVSVVLGGVPA